MRRAARVPEGRAERCARLGSMLAGIAGEATLEALRRVPGRGENEGSLMATPAKIGRAHV